jgi:hypothetical protein
MITLFLLCLIVNIITIKLYFKSTEKVDKRILLFIIVGQIVGLYGFMINNNKIIELSHIIFFISLILGSLFFKERINKFLILITLIITITTREVFNDCLFCIVNDNIKLINIDLPYGLIYNILMILIIIKY